MKFVRFGAIFLLAFLGISAIVGAAPMIYDPGGRPWQMPQSLLDRSSFHSYLIPGIILLCANGLLSLWVLWRALMRATGYGLLVSVQGCVLLGWLVAECVVIRLVIWPHYFYGAIALMLIAGGLILRKELPEV